MPIGPAPVFPEYATAPEMLHTQVATYGDAELLVCGDQRLTYRDAEAQSAVIAHRLLELGVGKGTRVGVLLPSGTTFVVHWLAVTRIGATFVPLSTFLTVSELLVQLRDADVHTLVVRDRFLGHDRVAPLMAEVPGLNTGDAAVVIRVDALPHLRHVVVDVADDPPRPDPLSAPERARLAAVEARVEPSDDAVVLHTSGSISDPKGVLHTQATMVRHPYSINVVRGIDATDRLYLAIPLFWVAGFSHGLVGAFVAGACVVVDERFSPELALDTIERERVTIVSGWPFHAELLTSEPSYPTRDLTHLRTDMRNLLVPAGHDLDLAAWPSWIGMTETFGAELLAPAGERVPTDLAGSFGSTAPGLEHRIVDPETGVVLDDDQEGELQVRGYSVMRGYLGKQREEVFTPDGFLSTGDRGRFRDHHFFLTGRTTDMIKTSGANVAPAEVELALRSVDGVLAAYVVGIPDAQRGELVAAAIVERAPRAVDLDTLTSRLRSKLSAFKVPKHVVVLEAAEVPMTASAKVRRGDLRALLVERIERTSSLTRARGRPDDPRR